MQLTMPLSSLRVLDFSTLLPGPFASMMLADLGARVLRIEAPHRADMVRAMPPLDARGRSPSDLYLNRSKQALRLDLKCPAAVQIVKRLIVDYDIVLEQYRPGVMDRLGLGYADLERVHAGLIYCSLTGYGQSGPYRDRAGHDNNYTAVSGLADYSGTRAGGPPLWGTPMADVAGGSLHAVIGILAAVIERQRSGRGQAIDVSMTDAMFAMNAVYGPGWLHGGVQPQAEKMLLNGGSFYGYYRTRDQRYLAVGGLEPKFREQLCIGLGRPDLAALACSDAEPDQHKFKGLLTELFLSKTRDEWMAVFADLDACVEPVLSFAEAARHPQILARGLVVNVPDGGGASVRQLACPLKFSRSTPVYRHLGGAGAQDHAVLRDHGFDDAEIASYAREGAFGDAG